ncbi:MAG: tetratricopeptide repeat protein [Bacteroidales bacterium]|nr:tetratricopeptide repeat protein [Bacteroidales bacterium]
MDKTELLNRLSRISEVAKDEWEENCALAEQFPYSLPLRLLALTSRKVWGGDKVDAASLRLESLYMPSSTTMKTVVESAKSYEPERGTFDIMKEINAYQEVSFKTAPKSVILSKFLQDGGYPASEASPVESLESLGKKSIVPDSSLVSETLALLLERQGKFEKAIEMYEKLCILYPEKNTIFASRIAEIQGL